MQVSIVGTGYIGLTTGLALAHLGHQVICIDVDEAKIGQLRAGDIPFHEPHLKELIHLVKSHIRFTTDYSSTIPNSDIVFISVGTPSLPDGSTDLTQVRAATREIGRHLGKNFTVIVNKSTMPIGSGDWIESLIRESFHSAKNTGGSCGFAVAANPEFLREGSALFDTFFPDRLVIGSDNSQAIEMLYTLYKPIAEQTFNSPVFLPRPESMGAVPILTTDLTSAELIKYAANSFLSLKISFINEIAQLAEKFGADITQVSKGIGLDSRIGTRFLQAGIGWGGSCLGKDTAALVAIAQEHGIALPIVKASREVNYRQRDRIVDKLFLELQSFHNRTIGLMGLSFKPNTDDVRDAPSLDIARKLTDRGAEIRAHDPVASKRFRHAISDLRIDLCANPEDLFEDADAILLVTEWPQYLEIPWEEYCTQMRMPLIVDGRNFLDRDRLEKAGFKYVGVGR